MQKAHIRYSTFGLKFPFLFTKELVQRIQSFYEIVSVYVMHFFLYEIMARARTSVYDDDKNQISEQAYSVQVVHHHIIILHKNHEYYVDDAVLLLHSFLDFEPCLS